jgi:hypothetical protein
VPFTYLNDNWTDEMFLGQIIPPEDLTVEALKNIADDGEKLT